MKSMKVETVVVGALETNCYLVYCEKTLECAVVDPGADPEKILRAIADKNLKPVTLINTHGHVDHIGANKDIKDRFDVPLLIHEGDVLLLQNALLSEIAFLLGAQASPDPDSFLREGDEVRFGESRLQVLHTPGHSPGSVSLQGEGLLLSGDTLFCGGVGRTDLPGGSWDELVRSIQERIFTLDGQTRVYPGHGPSTSVDQEKNANPYVR
jgi:glyoxylase-like metal-dependent hydrolase (beta-lactamase superfamily II)